MASLHDTPLLVFDGACGTSLQDMTIPDEAWDGREGCNELLNVTYPEAIVELHRGFVDAGAMVLETNTFGATGIVLAEYGLQDRVDAINRAAVANARTAIGDRTDCWVAGSMGPTTKLVSLGHVTREALADAYREQAEALINAGVDCLILETCQDLLQVKTALVTIFELLDQQRRDVPVLVSVTIEQTGTMLVGSDMPAVCATLEPFPVFSLGMNCATGPRDMESHLRCLARDWPGRISCLPNQGLPEVRDGRTVYRLSPAEFAAQLRDFVHAFGISIVGGCCGTTPAHIRALADALAGDVPGARGIGMNPSIASLYQAVELAQDPRPLLIGERCNANGSKRFRDCLLADDFDGCVRIAQEQEEAGAHVLDLCTAYAGRDEQHDLTTLLPKLVQAVRLPLVIDSTTPDCIEACLKLYPGRCIINSINLEDGGDTLNRVCPIIRRYGAAVIALTINKGGMAMTCAEKIATAKAIHELAVGRHGLRPSDLLFDALTFTIGSGDESLRDAAMQTLDAIRGIKAELPGVFTVLGLSNISFGLPPRSRRILNSVFLHEAVEAGLDAAIVDAGKIVPLAGVDEADRQACLDLIYDRPPAEPKPLMRYIAHFDSAAEESSGAAADAGVGPSEQGLHAKVVRGDKAGLEDLLSILLRRYAPTAIINQVLVPAMRHVGVLFGRGDMLLPFVLQSAEVMKRAVTYLEPFMDKTVNRKRTRILLATVQGDVHDIGKNLVDIILSNNGYTVHNLGIKVPAETIIAKARELEVDLIGLSGLLVKSAIVMQQSMSQYAEAGLTAPILLGGAALTRKFVAESCVPGYGAPVVYCPDAFAGLKAVRAFEDGTLAATTYVATAAPPRKQTNVPDVEITRDNPIPTPPFLGRRYVADVDLRQVLTYVNEQALFRGRWGYRRGGMDADAYAAIIRDTVEPLYADLCRRAVDDALVQPRVAYGYFPCYREGNTVVVEDEDRTYTFAFPRREDTPRLCIADFYRSKADGGDICGFFVVTIGAAIGEATGALFAADAYHDYLMLHGFSVEVTDALAEYWHEVMRGELGIAADRPASSTGYVVQEYQGSRYGFGYPACPDLGAHVPLFQLLKPEAIGVTLTENMQMVPEQTTSAIVAHHPQAKYFAV